jgi:ribosomal protein S18 acetylase RimI-like enzyme
LERSDEHVLTRGEVHYDLRDLDPDRGEDVAAISELHETLLPKGIAGLGTRFLREFFYSTLVREKLIHGVLCRIDGDPAGFITTTQQPGTILSMAIRRYWPAVVWPLTVTVLYRPATLIRLLRLLRLNAFRVSKRRAELTGSAQILAIGVRPQYRDPRFVRSSGIQVAPNLVEHAVSWAVDLGLREMHLEVEVSDRKLLLFYKALGWQSERYLSESGVPMIRVHLDLTELRGERRSS